MELCCVCTEADDGDDENEIDEYEDDVEGYTPGRIAEMKNYANYVQ